MNESFKGRITITDPNDNERIVLHGRSGSIHLHDQLNDNFPETISLIGNRTEITLRASNNNGDIIFNGNSGDFKVRRDFNGARHSILSFDASQNCFRVGSSESDGSINLYGRSEVPAISLQGARASISVGCKDNEGDILVYNNTGDVSFQVNGKEGDIFVYRMSNGEHRKVLHFDASSTALYLGCANHGSDIVLNNSAGDATILLHSDSGSINIKRRFNNELRKTMEFAARHAALYLGCKGEAGNLVVRDNNGKDTIHLDGNSGDIVLSNADAAELFDAADSVTIMPGMIMSLAEDGKIEPSSQPYDKKVVGIVAGAGPYRPGIVLGKRDKEGSHALISVLGKACCLADATNVSIEPGDLLTTSSTVGHAMKATDPLRSHGAVVGKALTGLSGRVGEVHVLVMLH